jgi:integrase
MRRDPWRHRDRYIAWRRKNNEGIEGLSPATSRLILDFLDDMELGRNVAGGSRLGARSHARLNNLRQRLTFVARELRQRYGVQLLTDVSEAQLHEYFGGMRSGAIHRLDGKTYRSTGDYVKVFRSFWRWHMKTQRKEGKSVPDLCLDLDDRSERAPWVYLTREDVERLCRQAPFKYRVLITFLFDTGIRSPTELLNVRVEDIAGDASQLRIREGTSKTFGRTINLMLGSSLVREWIAARGLGPGDFLFSVSPQVVNRTLRGLGARVLGCGRSPAGKPYDRLTMYDFRHSAACYWLPRYKQESALKYRFGWKRTQMIEYYTDFLGMKDTITADDLDLGTDRTAMEQKLDEARREKVLLEERLQAMNTEMQRILQIVDRLADKVAPSLPTARERGPILS